MSKFEIRSPRGFIRYSGDAEGAIDKLDKLSSTIKWQILRDGSSITEKELKDSVYGTSVEEFKVGDATLNIWK